MRKVRQYGFHLRPALAVRPASQRQFKQMEHKRQDGLLDPYPANWHARLAERQQVCRGRQAGGQLSLTFKTSHERPISHDEPLERRHLSHL